MIESLITKVAMQHADKKGIQMRGEKATMPLNMSCKVPRVNKLKLPAHSTTKLPYTDYRTCPNIQCIRFFQRLLCLQFQELNSISP